MGAYNTVLTGPGAAACVTPPPDLASPTPQPPVEAFSTDTVEADCTGQFKLCYTFKALSAPSAQPVSATDCVMKVVCTEAHYDKVNVTQKFPDLPGWVTDSPAEQACAATFVQNGGYAEMSVQGESDECEKLDTIFQVFTYCPPSCRDPNDPKYDPVICPQCKTGGGGRF